MSLNSKITPAPTDTIRKHEVLIYYDHHNLFINEKVVVVKLLLYTKHRHYDTT
jgi:hypothetical protein